MRLEGAGRALLWLGIYLLLILAPLLALILSTVPAKGGFWWNLAIGAGFAGLAMMVMQFFLTARLRHVTAPFGIDIVYYFHRFLAYGLCFVLLLHASVLLGLDASLFATLHPSGGEWRIQSGGLALLAVLVLMVSSVWRRQLRLAYEHWRRLHFVVAAAAVAFGFVHLHAVGYYGAAPLVRALWWSIALALVLLVLHVHVLRPWLLRRKPWTVGGLKAEQGSCWTLTLRPLGHPGLVFAPGQFAWLSLGHAPFRLAEHPFSLAGAPRADGSVQFTIKELGDFTDRIGATPLGTRAFVDGPYGIFSCDRHANAPGYVFIGGGIGIAPILGVLESLAERGDERPHLLVAAHSRFDRIPRRDELVAIAARLDLRTVPVLEEPPAGWQGERGWITFELLERHLTDPYRGHRSGRVGGAVPRALCELHENRRGVWADAARRQRGLRQTRGESVPQTRLRRQCLRARVPLCTRPLLRASRSARQSAHTATGSARRVHQLPRGRGTGPDRGARLGSSARARLRRRRRRAAFRE